MKTIIRVFVVLLTLLYSCTNRFEDTPDVSDSHFVSEVALRDIAIAFSSVSLEQDDVLSVFSSVQSAQNYGLDEEMYLSELWLSPLHTKVSETGEAGSVLREKIVSFLKNNTRSSTIISSDPSELLNLMKSGEIEIYWPYSENWDGVSIPVITYMQELDEDGCAIAFKGIGTEGIETILISEEYSYHNPVWVINTPDLDYNDIPNFNEGEISSKGVAYLPCTPVTRATDTTRHYYWGLAGITCIKQYDGWLAGASDFRFVIAYPAGNTGSVTGATTEFRVKVKRKYIRDKEELVLSSRKPLNQDWTESQVTNYLCLYEENGGRSQEVSVTVKYSVPDSVKKTFGLAEVSATAKFTIGKKDETVGKDVMNRAYVFSDRWANQLYPMDYNKNGQPNVSLRFVTEIYN